MMALSIQDLIDIFNDRCARGEWFWVAGLAREVWPALWPIPAGLDPIAAQAIAQYATENE